MDNKTIAELHRNAESMGLTIVSYRLPRDTCGLYDDRRKLILLADWLNQRQRRCTLCHELIHAKHHDSGCGTQYVLKCERRGLGFWVFRTWIAASVLAAVFSRFASVVFLLVPAAS